MDQASAFFLFENCYGRHKVLAKVYIMDSFFFKYFHQRFYVASDYLGPAIGLISE